MRKFFQHYIIASNIPVIYRLLLAMTILTLLNCKDKRKESSTKSSTIDTLSLLQTVLDYPEIKNDYTYFQGQDMKLVQNEIVKPNYKLLYRGKTVDVVQLKEEGSDIGRAYPRQFYIGLSVVRAFSNDSAQVVYLNYAESATSVFTLRKDDCSWKITSAVYGKY